MLVLFFFMGREDVPKSTMVALTAKPEALAINIEVKGHLTKKLGIFQMISLYNAYYLQCQGQPSTPPKETKGINPCIE